MHKLLFPDNLYNYHTADLMPTPFVWEGVSALQAARMLISSNKFVLFLVISCQIRHQHLSQKYFRPVEV